MKQSRYAAQVMVFAVIALLAIAYTVRNVLGVTFSNDTYAASATLPTAGGLIEGGTVTYRGIAVGTVTDLSLTDDGVRVDVDLDRDYDVPKSSTARVHDFSVAGEQYLDLTADSSAGPMLADGDTIRPAGQSTPVPISQTLKAIQDTVSSLDPEQVGTVSRELATGLTGSSQDIASTIDASISLVDALRETQPETRRLLRNSDVVLDTIDDHGEEFVQFADDVEKLSASLESSSPDLDTLLRESPTAVERFDGILRVVDPLARALVTDANRFTAVQVKNLDQLADALVAIPEFGRTVPLTVRGGRLNAAALFNDTQPVCTYPGQSLSNPLSGLETPLRKRVCADPQGADISRGAR